MWPTGDCVWWMRREGGVRGPDIAGPHDNQVTFHLFHGVQEAWGIYHLSPCSYPSMCMLYIFLRLAQLRKTGCSDGHGMSCTASTGSISGSPLYMFQIPTSHQSYFRFIRYMDYNSNPCIFLRRPSMVEVHAVSPCLLVLHHLEVVRRQPKRLQDTITQLRAHTSASAPAIPPSEGEHTCFNLPIISPISFSCAALIRGGSPCNCRCTTFRSAAVRFRICESVL